MPRDGSGGYSLIQNSWNPAINGAQALPNDWQALINDVATAIQGSLAADGQTPVTGVMNFQNNRISQVGAPIGAGDVLRWEQLVKGPDIASASSIAVPVEGMHFDVTGTTTITTIQDRYPGRLVVLKFLDELTITHSSSLLLPDGVDIETEAGDIGLFLNVSSGVWQCISWPNRVYTRDNVLGTVSQSGGVPTGALIESAINANGEYFRFAGGLQICRAGQGFTDTVSGIGSIFQGATHSYTFAASFATLPAVSVITYSGSAQWITATAISTGGYIVRPMSAVSGSISFAAQIIAIGRWY